MTCPFCFRHRYRYFRNPRAERPGAGPRPSYTWKCKKCGKPTKEQKDYCTEHIEEQAYAGGILEKLQRRVDELEAVKKRGADAISADSPILHELLGRLTSGGKTVERLTRDMSEFEGDNNITQAYVDFAKQKGLVQLGRTTRGSTTVKLVSKKSRRNPVKRRKCSKCRRSGHNAASCKKRKRKIKRRKKRRRRKR